MAHGSMQDGEAVSWGLWRSGYGSGEMLGRRGRGKPGGEGGTLHFAAQPLRLMNKEATGLTGTLGGSQVGVDGGVRTRRGNRGEQNPAAEVRGD